jgi:hypothetical protein
MPEEKTTNLSLPVENWEAELWSIIKSGDGIHCPFSKSCKKKDGLMCFDSKEEKVKNSKIHVFLDQDTIDDFKTTTFPRLAECDKRNYVIDLIRKLAQKYLDRNWNGSLPVPENLITSAPDGQSVEIRKLLLKAIHGAVWKLNKNWIIFLNSSDSAARQRFTLYHEIFHILAHSHGLVFFNGICEAQIPFNEFIADYFSGNILLPPDLIRKKWSEIQDIDEMVKLFNVPGPIIYGNLRKKRLV